MSVPGPVPAAPVPRPPAGVPRPPAPAVPRPPTATPPSAGQAEEHPALAAALQEVADLDDRPLAEHHERLSRAHEALQAVLDPTDR